MKSKGFTLIELLVVISIIGVISSIAFVSFSGQRDKAKLARAQQFSAQVNHALGAYAVGIWRFEEGAGTLLHDESGYGNNGTFHGNPAPVFSDGVYSGTTALQFDGVDDYVDCGSNASLDIESAGTIEMWVYPTTLGGLFSRSVGTAWVHERLVLNFYGTGGKLDLTLSDGINFWRHQSNSVVSTGQWTHIAVTFDGTNVKHYFNGILDRSQSQGGISEMTGVKTWIGRVEGLTPDYFDGTIDDVRIYNEVLSVAQIQQHYAEGVVAHGIVLR